MARERQRESLERLDQAALLSARAQLDPSPALAGGAGERGSRLLFSRTQAKVMIGQRVDRLGLLVLLALAAWPSHQP
jgi:hypothetical protein